MAALPENGYEMVFELVYGVVVKCVLRHVWHRARGDASPGLVGIEVDRMLTKNSVV